tara:strand:+ start:46197 stop:47687 length:1491 start_codon:yes stop_codon:yes gene_type:complete
MYPDSENIMNKITSPLLSSMKKSQARTTNGCVTNSTSGSFLVDFFFECGAMRLRSDEDIVMSFSKAFEEDPTYAMRILFWARDVRGGLGERRLFNVIIKHIAINKPEVLRGSLQLIPEYGRWDDLLTLFETNLEDDALSLIHENLSKSGGTNPLCAKWMPREKSSKRSLAKKIINKLGISPKAYRKLLSEGTSVVENKMCSNDWNSIDYDKVPSVAMKNYTKAFIRHSPDLFKAYIDDVSAGKRKINSSVLYPHDIVASMSGTLDLLEDGERALSIRALEQQWAALPNWLMSNPHRILPVVDTSGSMLTGFGSIRPIDVSVSLGLYIAERNNGPFEDHFVTFSESPTLQSISGDTLLERINSVRTAGWGYSTNLESVFDLILESAKRDSILEEDMPNIILVLSDMEFDSCSNNYNSDAITCISRKYSDCGYKAPRVIFWNLNASGGNFPVTFDETGTALVSGFSPSILKQLLSEGDISPVKIMREVVESDRYNFIK